MKTSKDLSTKALEALVEAFRQPTMNEALTFISKRALADPSIPLGLEILQKNLELITDYVKLSMFLELSKEPTDATTSS